MPGRLDELEQYAIDVILERRHGVRPTLLRSTLRMLSHLYLGIVQLRIYLYRTRILKERQLGCLVISIGNLTVGGTGKTPVVEKFARALQKGGDPQPGLQERRYPEKKELAPKASA
jgi:tetraacyldisaccharide 4'-kinase